MSNSDIINEYNQSFCRNCHRQFDDSASCSNWQPSLIIRRPRQKRKLLMNSQDKGLWRQINAKPPNNHSLFCLLSMGTRDQSKLLFFLSISSHIPRFFYNTPWGRLSGLPSKVHKDSAWIFLKIYPKLLFLISKYLSVSLNQGTWMIKLWKLELAFTKWKNWNQRKRGHGHVKYHTCPKPVGF